MEKRKTLGEIIGLLSHVTELEITENSYRCENCSLHNDADACTDK